VPPSTYAPVPSYSTFGNGADNPSVTYDADRYDRVAIMTAAAKFCAAQGKSSAFSGRTGSLVHYDCVPYSDANHAVQAPIYVPTTAPYVVYEFTTGSQTTFDTQAAAYCTAQGRAAVFRSQDGTRITYDCVLAGQPYVAPAYNTYAANVPVAVPTISYSTAGNSQANVDTQAIRYCGMLGKSPVLRDQYYSNRTYTCQ
jgi:putative hemolysin